MDKKNLFLEYINQNRYRHNRVRHTQSSNTTIQRDYLIKTKHPTKLSSLFNRNTDIQFHTPRAFAQKASRDPMWATEARLGEMNVNYRDTKGMQRIERAWRNEMGFDWRRWIILLLSFPPKGSKANTSASLVRLGVDGRLGTVSSCVGFWLKQVVFCLILWFLYMALNWHVAESGR